MRKIVRDRVYVSSWKAGTGKVRRYVNNWWLLCGLDVDYYKTGSVRSAALNGEHVSNSCAYRIMEGSVWVDSEGKLHLDHHKETHLIPLGKRREAVTKWLGVFGSERVEVL